MERLLVRGELFHEGEAGTQLYVVVHGRLKVVTTSSGGDDVVFSIPGPGDVIGELGFLGGGPRTASVIALEDCELLALDRRDLLPLLRSRPAVALRLLEALAQRLRAIDRFTKDTLFANVSVRLAKRLLELAARYGEPTKDGVRISLRLSQEEIGDFAAATREAVNRQLRAWTEAGIVAMARGDITIRQPAQLEAIASLAAA